MTTSPILSIRFPKKTLKQIDAVAAETGVSRSEVVRGGLEFLLYLFDPHITVEDALDGAGKDVTLADAIKNRWQIEKIVKKKREREARKEVS